MFPLARLFWRHLEKLKFNLFEIWLTDPMTDSNNTLIRFIAMMEIMGFLFCIISKFQQCCVRGLEFSTRGWMPFNSRAVPFLSEQQQKI